VKEEKVFHWLLKKSHKTVQSKL